MQCGGEGNRFWSQTDLGWTFCDVIHQLSDLKGNYFVFFSFAFLMCKMQLITVPTT